MEIFHHENILKSNMHKHGFAVIDPKGAIGECGFDLACFILNPISDLFFNSNSKQIIENRIHKISKILDLNSKRLAQWCFVKAVLSSSFAIEDNLTKIRNKFVSLVSVCRTHL